MSVIYIGNTCFFYIKYSAVIPISIQVKNCDLELFNGI